MVVVLFDATVFKHRMKIHLHNAKLGNIVFNTMKLFHVTCFVLQPICSFKQTQLVWNIFTLEYTATL